MKKIKKIFIRGFLCTACLILTALLAQIEIPLPYVPISGQTLAIGLTATVLGSRLGTLTVFCYIGIGALGLPVFTGSNGGLSVLTGPAGGYIFGFAAAAFVIGYFLEKNAFTVKIAVLANIIGMIIILLCGVIQLKFVLTMSWPEAMAAGVYPFLITRLIKAFLAAWIGITLRKTLEHYLQ